MAKVKIPLEVANGFKARNIEELKENFDIKKIVGYFLDGRLHKWLEDRYYDDELEAINKLSTTDECLADKLCEIFNVVQDTSSIVIEDISKTNERLGLIREITDDDKLIDQAERMARSQEELDKLVSSGEKNIYLLDGTFKIDLTYENVKYIGIKAVVAEIESSKKIDFSKKRIYFENIDFDEEYAKISKITNVYDNVANDLYIDESGKVKFFKWNNVSSFGNGEDQIPHISEKVIHISYASYFALAVDIKGQVYTWGAYPYKMNRTMDFPPIRKAVCVDNGFFVLDCNGKIHYRGGTNFNELFINTKTESYKPMPDTLPTIKYLYGKQRAVFAIDEEGKLYNWGLDIKIPESLSNLVKVSYAGHWDNLITLDDEGNIFASGKSISNVPATFPQCIDVCAYRDGVVAIDVDGKLCFIGEDDGKIDVDNLPQFKSVYESGRYGGKLLFVDADNYLWGLEQGKIKKIEIDNKMISVLNYVRMDING